MFSKLTITEPGYFLTRMFHSLFDIWYYYIFPWIKYTSLYCVGIFSCTLVVVSDHLFQPKTDLFPTHDLIWVHFKTVRYFSQPISSLFSYLKNARHNLVIELCSALFVFKNIAQVFNNFTQSFVAFELLTFYNNAKKLFIAW